MIGNQRQYAITRAELRRFEEAAEERRRQGAPEGVDPRVEKATVEGLLSQAETLRGELRRYDDLREGRIGKRRLERLRELPEALIEARIAAGLSQKALGRRLGVKEQQVQRWEANLYSGVGVERLQDVVDALGMDTAVTVGYAARTLPG